jgi:hypothetical protein
VDRVRVALPNGSKKVFLKLCNIFARCPLRKVEGRQSAGLNQKTPLLYGRETMKRFAILLAAVAGLTFAFAGPAAAGHNDHGHHGQSHHGHNHNHAHHHHHHHHGHQNYSQYRSWNSYVLPYAPYVQTYDPSYIQVVPVYTTSGHCSF